MPVPIRSAEDIEAIARAGEVVWRVLDEMVGVCAPGVTSRELDARCERRLRELGAEAVLRGFRDGATPGFPGVCCVNINEQIAHATPSERAIVPGDVVSIDLTAGVGGWIADACRSVVVPGGASTESTRLVGATREALARMLRWCRAGERWSSVAAAASGAARQGGFRLVPGLAGHGVGRAVHEPPLCWLGSPGPDFVLRPGMILTLEPILTASDGGMRSLDDRWTIVALDGAISAGEERTIAITRRGARVLTGPDPREA
ncbi:MAG: type I methionyl aminopeptidase [Phycisphaerales bacterium]